MPTLASGGVQITILFKDDNKLYKKNTNKRQIVVISDQSKDTRVTTGKENDEVIADGNDVITMVRALKFSCGSSAQRAFGSDNYKDYGSNVNGSYVRLFNIKNANIKETELVNHTTA
jgi:hypothetical protein